MARSSTIQEITEILLRFFRIDKTYKFAVYHDSRYGFCELCNKANIIIDVYCMCSDGLTFWTTLCEDAIACEYKRAVRQDNY